MKYIITAIALLALVGCAKPPMEPTVIAIPVNLVNVSDNTVVIPAKPAPGPHYEEGDTVRVALHKWVAYAKLSQRYEASLADNLNQCTVDNAGMREQLHKIRQFILLNQQALPAN